jgi:hypothetical protein
MPKDILGQDLLCGMVIAGIEHDSRRLMVGVVTEIVKDVCIASMFGRTGDDPDDPIESVEYTSDETEMDCIVVSRDRLDESNKVHAAVIQERIRLGEELERKFPGQY